MKRTDDSINAELKNLRLRIIKLEQIVLNIGSDLGKVNEEPKKDKKG